MNRLRLYNEPALQVKNEDDAIAHLTALSLGPQSTWVASEDIQANTCKIKIGDQRTCYIAQVEDTLYRGDYINLNIISR